MRAYSLDLRQRVLADCDRGQGTKPVATKYGVSPAWVRRLKQRRRETGEIGPRKLGPPKGGRWAAHHDRLRALNAERPDATLVELRDALGLPVRIWTIWRALRERKLSFKKNVTRGRARPAGRRRAADGMAGLATGARPAPPRFHRRNLGDDEPEPPLWALSAGPAAGGQSPARPLEDHYLSGGVAARRPVRPAGDRRGAHGRPLPGLWATAARVHPAARRPGDLGQALRPQGVGRAQRHRGRAGQLGVLAAVQPGLQPHRAGLRQTTTPAADGGRTRDHEPMAPHRRLHRPLHPPRNVPTTFAMPATATPKCKMP
jgi:transposase